MATLTPASRVEVFEVVVPALTPKSQIFETQTNWNPGELVGVEVVIPDGPNYLAGIAIALAHQIILPRTSGGWIVGNDEKLEWSLVGYPNSGAWSVIGYNTDRYAHTFHVRYLISDFAMTGANPDDALIATPLVV
jgi:hypothetical protein